MVRVRFAPSPTGYLHVGGARTAVFNWLYARRSGGTFVLRIEDTDVERSSKQSEAALVEDLRWLGLAWDEGPDVGGPHGPYRQSERVEIYRREARILEERGLAYPCFCTDEDLERKRRSAVERGESPHYDGTCRGLDPGEVEGRRSQALPETLRFRVREGRVWFEDCVRGGVEFSTSMVGDFVILRSNGLPTYNFAAVVDDSAMGITHVLRGEEHLPNTMRQILLYEALEKKPPVFGHLPLILGEDRTKLSKRHGASSIAELRKRGFLPSAVVNYLALLGWSHSEEREVLSVEELVGDFALERVGKSPAVFDMEKLRWMNGMHIRRRSSEELLPLAEEFFPAELKAAYPIEKRKEILDLVHEKIETLEELDRFARLFSEEVEPDGEAREALAGERAGRVLEVFAGLLERLPEPLEAGEVKGALKEAGKLCGVSGRELYFPIRAAVTGRVHGPDLAGTIAVKGKSVVMGELKRARAGGGERS